MAQINEWKNEAIQVLIQTNTVGSSGMGTRVVLQLFCVSPHYSPEFLIGVDAPLFRAFSEYVVMDNPCSEI